MSEVEGQGPEEPPPSGRGAGSAWRRLQDALRTGSIRDGLYFVLGAVAAGAVALVWSVDDLGLAPPEAVPPQTGIMLPGPVLAAQAQGADRRQVFHWRDRAGTDYRAIVDAERYRDFAVEQRRRIETARDRLSRETDAWVREELHPVLEGVEGRVADYGDWMYNWWTAWILLGQAFAWTWQGLLDGVVLDLPNRVHGRLVQEIREHYDTVVLRPEVVEPQMHALIDRAVARVQREVQSLCGPLDNARRRLLEASAYGVERDEAAGWTAVGDREAALGGLGSTCGAFDPEDEAKLTAALLADRPMSNLDAGVGEVVVRLSRPFATKLVSFMVLPVVTGAVAGGLAVPFLGLPAGALAGVLAGGAVSALVVGFSTSTAVDWVLTRIDEAMSRHAFEDELRHAVRQAAAAYEIRVRGVMARFVAREYGKLSERTLGLAP